MLDRLDEAFQGFPQAEVPALRALLRTYLDLLDFDWLTLKLFVRKDLFRRIIEGGFVNLTHVNSRKVEIVWDEEDLRDLLCRRLRENSTFIEALDVAPTDASNDDLFYAVFPRQVDLGSRRPTTWNWILSRIRDGNSIAPPRNLIDLVTKAQEAQLRKEQRGAARPHRPASRSAWARSGWGELRILSTCAQFKPRCACSTAAAASSRAATCSGMRVLTSRWRTQIGQAGRCAGAAPGRPRRPQDALIASGA